jgi:RimJ/RimL family protein N-acetyltransferase
MISNDPGDRGSPERMQGRSRRRYGLPRAFHRDAALRGEDAFIGFIGLGVPEFNARFTPCVEIGWRLAAERSNQGLATERAQAVLRYAFKALHPGKSVSFTVPAKLKFRRAMEKLGMSRDPLDDCDHPKLPEGHPPRRHVLYRIARPGAGSLTESEAGVEVRYTEPSPCGKVARGCGFHCSRTAPPRIA